SRLSKAEDGRTQRPPSVLKPSHVGELAPAGGLDNELADHAALHQSLRTELISSRPDGDEEQFGFAAILEFDLVERRRFDFDPDCLDLANPDIAEGGDQSVF